MKRIVRLVSLALALTMCAALLTGCGPFKRIDDSEEEIKFVADGGTITFPEGFSPVGRRNSVETVMMDSTLCAAFTQISVSSRSTDYFYPGSDTLTVVAQGDAGGSMLKSFRVNLWKRTDTGTEWVDTLYFRTDNTVGTGTFTGLDTNSRYRLSVAYDGSTTSCTGSLNASPVSPDGAQPAA